MGFPHSVSRVAALGLLAVCPLAEGQGPRVREAQGPRVREAQDPRVREAQGPRVREAQGPRVRVVLETRLADDTDAERVVLPAAALTAGKPMILQGRLARLTLVARPWDGDVWQVRYALEPGSGGGARLPPGVFSLRENETKEVWLGAGASGGPQDARRGPRAFHGVKLEFQGAARQGELRTL